MTRKLQQLIKIASVLFILFGFVYNHVEAQITVDTFAIGVGEKSILSDQTGNFYTISEQSGVFLTNSSGNTTAFDSYNGDFLAYSSFANKYYATFNNNNNGVNQISSGTYSQFVSLGAVPSPNGIVFDANGNLYVTAYVYNTSSSIYKVSANGSTITKFVDLPVANCNPFQIIFDASKTNLYVAGNNSSSVYKVDLNGNISTFASNLNGPESMAFDTYGNLYVTTQNDNSISQITPNGIVTTLSTGFQQFFGLCFYAGSLYAISVDQNLAQTFPPAQSGMISKISLSSWVAVKPNINYGITGVQYDTIGKPITPIIPTNTGTGAIYTVSPSLPAGLSVDSTTGIISGTATGVKGSTVYTITATNSAGTGTFQISIETSAGLPVIINDFNLLKQNKSVLVSWNTVTEINTSYFEVQRSADAINFSSIDRLAARGNSSVTDYYSFEDTNPLTGYNYYRLKEMDKDGKTTLSEVKSVSFSDNIMVSVYPIPAHNIVTINSGNFKIDHNTYLSISDMEGKLLQHIKVTNTTTSLNIAGLSAGFYLVSMQSGDNKNTVKIVVQ